MAAVRFDVREADGPSGKPDLGQAGPRVSQLRDKRSAGDGLVHPASSRLGEGGAERGQARAAWRSRVGRLRDAVRPAARRAALSTRFRPAALA